MCCRLSTLCSTWLHFFRAVTRIESYCHHNLAQGLDPATRNKVERLASGDENVLGEMLAEIDPDGSLKGMMADLSDPKKLAGNKKQKKRI